MTHFDVRIPGLEMMLVQADGQNVEPVTVEEFRIAPVETYDMIVRPRAEDAYTLFAEAMDRSGYAAGTLALREGMRAPIPERRARPRCTLPDMGVARDAMESMRMPSGETRRNPPVQISDGTMPTPAETRAHLSTPAKSHGPDRHSAGNPMIAEVLVSRVDEPGAGLGDAGWRVLVYSDLRRLSADSPEGVPEREIELHLTANMERRAWGFEGKTYAEAKEPILFFYGERLRVTLVNETVMDHSMHLHGMWMMLENGAWAKRPLKHTINVKAGERVSFDAKPDELGQFAFLCHLLLHAELGMLRIVSVVNSKGKMRI